MKRYTLGAISLFLIAFFTLPLLSAAKWKLVKSSGGIKVFTRPVEGSELDEFLGEITINTDVSVILAVLQDVPSQTKWMHNCKESRLIHKEGDFKRIVYNATHAPWPVSDRDVVVQTIVKRYPKKGMIVIDIKSTTHSSVPPKSGRVRMPSLKGSWTLYVLAEGKTKLQYRIKANPGGSLPAWLANATSKDIPYKTLQGMMKMVKQQKYLNDAKDIKKQFGGENWKNYK